ncbi:hypothetical protein ALO72_200124 [Pseudomonas syringae pv. delphinii]|nr:hypothetical protein ALO72_200124 [Pseudomonas syringae pv. delphinii]
MAAGSGLGCGGPERCLSGLDVCARGAAHVARSGVAQRCRIAAVPATFGRAAAALAGRHGPAPAADRRGSEHRAGGGCRNAGPSDRAGAGCRGLRPGCQRPALAGVVRTRLSVTRAVLRAVAGAFAVCAGRAGFTAVQFATGGLSRHFWSRVHIGGRGQCLCTGQRADAERVVTGAVPFGLATLAVAIGSRCRA